MGLVPMEREILRKLFDYIQEDELRRVAVCGADEFTSKLPFMTRTINLDSFLNITRLRAQKSGFCLSESMEDGEIILVMLHEINRKWSVFFSEYHKRVLDNLEYPVEMEVRDNLWAIRIRTNGKAFERTAKFSQ